MIETNRLSLRQYVPADIDAILGLFADESLRQFIGNTPSSVEEAWRRLLGCTGHWSLFGYGAFAVVEKRTDRIIGEVGVSHFLRGVDTRLDSVPEASWMFAEERQGEGFAYEAMSALLRWLEHTAAQPSCACLVEPMNKPSMKLARRLGFTSVDQVFYRAKQFDLLIR